LLGWIEVVEHGESLSFWAWKKEKPARGGHSGDEKAPPAGEAFSFFYLKFRISVWAKKAANCFGV
jgi:hypothetical protein